MNVQTKVEQESVFDQKIGYLDERDIEILTSRPPKDGVDPSYIVNLRDYEPRKNRRN